MQRRLQLGPSHGLWTERQSMHAPENISYTLIVLIMAKRHYPIIQIPVNLANMQVLVI